MSAAYVSEIEDLPRLAGLGTSVLTINGFGRRQTNKKKKKFPAERVLPGSRTEIRPPKPVAYKYEIKLGNFEILA